MRLPIDCKSTHFPIKEKYIDSETPELSTWMVFGSRADGTVDVSNANGDDVFTSMDPKTAAEVVRDRNAWVAKLLQTLNGKAPHWA